MLSKSIIDALNYIGMWHGTFTIPPECNISNSEFQRWIYPELESFGGLYITPEKKSAEEYGYEGSKQISDYFKVDSEYSIHKIKLLSSVELALDEDNFNWPSAVQAYYDNETLFWEYLRPTTMLENFIEKSGLVFESGIVITADEALGLTPDDFHGDVEEWTTTYLLPALNGWLNIWKDSSVFIAPPILRILNDDFIATPPLPLLT